MNKSFTMFDIQCDKEDIMPAEHAALADLLRNRMLQLGGLSTYEVARRSGNRISNGTVWNILNGRTRDVKAQTLRALAQALLLPEEEVFAAARGKLQHGLKGHETRLLIYFQELPKDRQEDVVRIIRALHREHAVKPEADVKSIESKKRKPRAA